MNRTLDRIPFFDDRSRNFSVKSLFSNQEVNTRKRRIWTTIKTPLDQGREGACVGFGWAHELGATPKPYQVDNARALDFYNLSRIEDRTMGNNWSEGASVLAGAKAISKLNLITRYHWAFGVRDVLQTLIRKGPVIIGVNWYESMYSTSSAGLVHIGGDLVGGHCLMVSGWWPDHPMFGDCFVWQNSWGFDYGVNGVGFIRFGDLDRLLRENGEACIPTDSVINKKKVEVN